MNERSALCAAATQASGAYDVDFGFQDGYIDVPVVQNSGYDLAHPDAGAVRPCVTP